MPKTQGSGQAAPYRLPATTPPTPHQWRDWMRRRETQTFLSVIVLIVFLAAFTALVRSNSGEEEERRLLATMTRRLYENEHVLHHRGRGAHCTQGGNPWPSNTPLELDSLPSSPEDEDLPTMRLPRQACIPVENPTLIITPTMLAPPQLFLCDVYDIRWSMTN